MSPKDLNRPGGWKTKTEFLKYLLKKIKECIDEKKSKEETENHLFEKFQIEPKHTRILWNRIEKMKPEKLKEIWKEAGAVEVTQVNPSIDSEKTRDLNIPDGCMNREEYANYIVKKTKECYDEKKSKEETVNHLWEKFQIEPIHSRRLFGHIERMNPKQLELLWKKAGIEVTGVDSRNTKELNLPGGCKRIDEFADYLIKKFKECKGEKKGLRETMNHLSENFEIDARYTRSCFFHLRDEKPDAFRLFVNGLQKIHDRIENEKKASEQVTTTQVVESSIDLTELDLPGGCKWIDEFADFLISKVKECIEENKSKTETEKDLSEQFEIDPRYTRMCLFRLRSLNPDASLMFVTCLRMVHDEIEQEKKKASEEATQVDSLAKTTELDLPGGCKSMEEFEDYLIKKVNECLGENKSLRETMNHLSEKFDIDPIYTRICLYHLADPDAADPFTSLIEDLRKRHEEIETEKKKKKKKKASEQVIAPAQAAQVESSEKSTKAIESKDREANVLNLPDGCYRMEHAIELAEKRIHECIVGLKSKEQTVKDLFEQFQIEPAITLTVWDDLEANNPDFFNPYNLDREHEQMLLDESEAKRAIGRAKLAIIEKRDSRTAPSPSSSSKREAQSSSEESALKKQKPSADAAESGGDSEEELETQSLDSD